MTQVSGSAGTAPVRGRGRPPRLSREQIVDAAAALVYEDPSAPLTIKRVADAADAAPMALYRYFPDRDDLLHAVADRVAGDMRFDPPTGRDWREQLRAWMVLSLDHLRPYPQLLPYIASTRRPAWLPSFTVLTDVLRPLKLTDADLALAITLIGTTVVGQAMIAAQRAPVDETMTVLRSALEDAGDDEQARIGPVLAELPGAFERLYDVVVDSTIATLEGLAGAPARRTGQTRRSAPSAALSPLFSNPDSPGGSAVDR